MKHSDWTMYWAIGSIFWWLAGGTYLAQQATYLPVAYLAVWLGAPCVLWLVIESVVTARALFDRGFRRQSHAQMP